MKVVAFTGAGISKESGIATFSEREDLREKLSRDFAINNPEEYNLMIKELKASIDNAMVNDAHIALKEYGVFVITMNIDGLHTKAGSTVLELHGTLPDDKDLDRAHLLKGKPVLYGDAAPNYQKAVEIVSELGINDYFLVIGCSFYTNIAVLLRDIARGAGATVIEIQDNAAFKVRETLEKIVSL